MVFGVELKATAFQKTAFIIFMIAGILTTINYTTMTKEIILKSVANTWSESIKGLSGRLRVEFEELESGLRHAIYLELKNHSLSPISIINQPEIHAELFDSAGKPVSTSGFRMSGPIPGSQRAVIPRDAYLGFRIDMQTVGAPTNKHGVVLLATAGKSWELRAGEYVLKTMLVFKKEDDVHSNQWIGELDLPPVEVLVTAETSDT